MAGIEQASSGVGVNNKLAQYHWATTAGKAMVVKR
jgi:hypothetical protein